MNPLIKKIQNFAFHNKLFSSGEKILIGVSGGPDSICLSRVFLEFRNKYDLKIALLHVNYGLRGEESERDEEFVREFAKKNELKLKVIQYEKLTTIIKGNLESDLRDFRRAEFFQFAKKEGFDKIALAHNSDDQTETFFMNLFRGAGSVGLSAMRPKRGKIIRPLLFVSKTEILELLKGFKQDYRIDKSNFDESFFRNKIRNKLVPILEGYSPRLRERVCQLSENLQDEREVVEEFVEKKYNDIVQSENGSCHVSVSDLKNCSRGIQKALFRLILEKLKGGLKDVSTNNFFEFSKILESTKSKTQTCIMNSVVIERKGDEIRFSRE